MPVRDATFVIRRGCTRHPFQCSCEEHEVELHAVGDVILNGDEYDVELYAVSEPGGRPYLPVHGEERERALDALVDAARAVETTR